MSPRGSNFCITPVHLVLRLLSFPSSFHFLPDKYFTFTFLFSEAFGLSNLTQKVKKRAGYLTFFSDKPLSRILQEWGARVLLCLLAFSARS